MRIHLATKRAAFAVLAALALTLGSLASGCGAGILPILITASTVASEVLAWIDRIVAFVDSTTELPHGTRMIIAQAVDRARAAAIALHHAARAGEQADRGEIEAAKRDCIAAVQALLDVVAPHGVTSSPAGIDGSGVYGLAPGGQLVVPTAQDMVGR